MHVSLVRNRKKKKELVMSELSPMTSVSSFFWSELETRLCWDDSDPLDQIIHKENIQQLYRSLFTLKYEEMVAVMMLHYDENMCDVSDVCDYFKAENKLEFSRHAVGRLEKEGLKKLKRQLKFSCGWEGWKGMKTNAYI